MHVAEGHILHSLATEDRINRVETKVKYPSLPNTFQVVDYEGNILHELTDTTDPTQNCFGYHGSIHREDTFVFACSHDLEEHGGLLFVDYDATTKGYTSRHLVYPNSNLSNHRTGGILAHPKSPYVVADFADWDAEVYAPHLFAFQWTDTTIGSDSVLYLGSGGQCDYEFEKSLGELVLVLLPSGVVQVYKFAPNWTLLAEVTILPPTSRCPWPAPFTVGYMQAFAFHNSTLFVMDLHDVEATGKIHVTQHTLGFTPYSMTVAGVPDGLECSATHEHDSDTPDSTTPSPPVSAPVPANPTVPAYPASAAWNNFPSCMIRFLSSSIFVGMFIY